MVGTRSRRTAAATKASAEQNSARTKTAKSARKQTKRKPPAAPTPTIDLAQDSDSSAASSVSQSARTRTKTNSKPPKTISVSKSRRGQPRKAAASVDDDSDRGSLLDDSRSRPQFVDLTSKNPQTDFDEHESEMDYEEDVEDEQVSAKSRRWNESDLAQHPFIVDQIHFFSRSASRTAKTFADLFQKRLRLMRAEAKERRAEQERLEQLQDLHEQDDLKKPLKKPKKKVARKNQKNGIDSIHPDSEQIRPPTRSTRQTKKTAQSKKTAQIEKNRSARQKASSARKQHESDQESNASVDEAKAARVEINLSHEEESANATSSHQNQEIEAEQIDSGAAQVAHARQNGRFGKHVEAESDQNESVSDLHSSNNDESQRIASINAKETENGRSSETSADAAAADNETTLNAANRNDDDDRGGDSAATSTNSASQSASSSAESGSKPSQNSGDPQQKQTHDRQQSALLAAGQRNSRPLGLPRLSNFTQGVASVRPSLMSFGAGRPFPRLKDSASSHAPDPHMSLTRPRPIEANSSADAQQPKRSLESVPERISDESAAAKKLKTNAEQVAPLASTKTASNNTSADGKPTRTTPAEMLARMRKGIETQSSAATLSAQSLKSQSTQSKQIQAQSIAPPRSVTPPIVHASNLLAETRMSPMNAAAIAAESFGLGKLKAIPKPHQPIEIPKILRLGQRTLESSQRLSASSSSSLRSIVSSNSFDKIQTSTPNSSVPNKEAQESSSKQTTLSKSNSNKSVSIESAQAAPLLRSSTDPRDSISSDQSRASSSAAKESESQEPQPSSSALIQADSEEVAAGKQTSSASNVDSAGAALHKVAAAHAKSVAQRQQDRTPFPSVESNAQSIDEEIAPVAAISSDQSASGSAPAAKNKPIIKSIQAAAIAAKREQMEKERRAQLRAQREQIQKKPAESRIPAAALAYASNTKRSAEDPPAPQNKSTKIKTAIASAVNSAASRAAAQPEPMPLAPSRQPLQPNEEVAPTASAVAGIKKKLPLPAALQAASKTISAESTPAPSAKPAAPFMLLSQSILKPKTSTPKSKPGVATIVDEHGNLPEPQSEDDDDDDPEDGELSDDRTPRSVRLQEKETRRKAIAAWAHTPDVQQAIRKQQKTDPDAIFGPIQPIALERVFVGASSRRDFRKRSSSAYWLGTDALTQEEDLDYKRRMGYISDTGASNE